MNEPDSDKPQPAVPGVPSMLAPDKMYSSPQSPINIINTDKGICLVGGA